MDANTLRPRHLRIARAIEETSDPDPERLLLHYQAAGEREKAGELAALAADRAARALAFDCACVLYKLALDLRPGDRANARALRTKLGDALLNAGRGAEAAAAYLDVARGAPARDAVELRRRAAEQLLISGHVDEGFEALRAVLEAAGLSYAGSSHRALATLLYRRARLKIRGTQFRERDKSGVPAEVLARIDVCFSVSLGLSVIDTIHAASFQAQHLLLALDAGEPNRIALGLAFEAGHVATMGGKERRTAVALVRAAESLAERLGNPQAEGFARLMSGVADWAVGEWRSGLASTQEAERILRERCTGVAWEIDTAQLFSMICMTSLGRLSELSRQHPSWMKEADLRGDRYARTSLRTFWGTSVLLALAQADPVRARREVDEVMSAWSTRGFHVQHYYALMSRVLVDIYEGSGRAAFSRVEDEWGALDRSMLLRVQCVRGTALYVRGSAALAAAEEARGFARRRLLERADKDAEALEEEHMAWSSPLAASLRAGALHLRGRADAAARALEDAVRGFDDAEMALYAASARTHAAKAIGGARGRAFEEGATRYFELEKVAEPSRMARALLPGWSSAR